ncbi:MAG: phospholipid carrier-dependent glycosyltransferase [Deltaproteobacteria bacterium]|nr:phospholipid carrier-dependent glycosyltransferase [Deltaproteobacteria bacterium]
MSRPRRIGRWDHLLGALLAAAYVALLLATAGDLAMSRDESFYVTAAQNEATWYQLLWDDSSAALEQPAIDHAWEFNHEHPALMKTLFAWSWLAQQKWHVFESDSAAFRFPGMLTGGLLLWLIYIFGARAFGRQVGAFAALAFALMPRVFYHSHLDCFDIPIVFFDTWVTYAYWRSLRKRRWAIYTGLIFGLALATKHNSWVLPGVFGIHFVWMAWAERARRKQGHDPARRMRLTPYWLLSMLVLGPPIMIGIWPWVWHDTLSRLAWYAGFHLHHVYYNMAYFGQNYFKPPFPISFPFVLTAFTVPATTLLLAFLGLGSRFGAILPQRLARLWPRDLARPDRARTDVLLVGSLMAPLLLIALPSTPIFGGTKHWIPAYPFVALYAGLGTWRVIRPLRKLLKAKLPRARNAARVLASMLLLAPSAVETIHSHPFGLSHYTALPGGVPGAADLGMNRQFWGFTTGSLVPYLREAMPDGGTVWICDTTWGAWNMLQRDGLLPRNIRPAASMEQADFVLVHLEHHFVEVDFQAWVTYGSVKLVHVLTYDGVPIINVYENPRHRARHDAAQAIPSRPPAPHRPVPPRLLPSRRP